MPKDLNQQQQDELRQRLKQRYDELREEIRQELINSDKQHFIDLAESVHDLEDASVADFLVDLELANIDRHIQEVRHIDLALLRIAEGSYGVCSDCGDAIPMERLLAYPSAQRCTICQEAYEKNHAHPSRSSL